MALERATWPWTAYVDLDMVDLERAAAGVVEGDLRVRVIGHGLHFEALIEGPRRAGLERPSDGRLAEAEAVLSACSVSCASLRVATADS